MNLSQFRQRGSILILFAITLPLLVLFSGMAVDLGYVYIQRSHMQNSADAAALAGATKLNTSDNAAGDFAQTYLNQNSTAADSGQSVTITYPHKNDLKKIRVDITEDIPLFFFRYFGYKTMQLTVHAIASCATTATNTSIFDYSIISGSKNDILTLGPGGANTYNGKIHSNYKLAQGGGNCKVNGEISAVSKDIWASTSQNSFSGSYTSKSGADAVDISLANSGLASLVEKIKNQSRYSGDYTGNVDFSKLGEGIYVNGKFAPNISSSSSLNATTIVIATGDIKISSNQGLSMKNTSRIILCSLTGNIEFIFSTPFYGILYAPNGNITSYMGGNTFNGSMAGKTISAGWGDSTINGKPFSGISGGGTSGSGKISLIE